MRKLDEIGICPHCRGDLIIYKTKNYKRFVKCELCGISYALPKRGSLNNSALECPKNGFPILIVDRKEQRAYFWSDQPCFNCTKYDTCKPINDLLSEFKELKVYGY